MEAAAPRLAVAFGVARCRVRPSETRADVVVISLDRRPGLGPMQFPPDHDDGRMVAPSLVGSSMLVGGNPGSGKSSALRTILSGLAERRNLALIGIDPKWVELGPWAPRLSTLVQGNEAEPVIELLEALNEEVQRRSRILADAASASWRPAPGRPAVYLVVDERAELGAAGTTKQQAEVGRLLRRFVALGRAVGCGAIIATQRPTSDTIDTGTKALLTHRLALRCGDKYGSEAILGASRYEAAGISAKCPGRGYLADGASLRPLQVFDVPHGEIASRLCPALRQEIDWLPGATR